MISLISLWEDGWLDPSVELFMWKQLSAAYAVDNLVLCPEKLKRRTSLLQFADISEALGDLPGKPVFLIPDAGIDLKHYEHPEDAIYIFGNAKHSNRDIIGNHDVCKIITPNKVDFFGINAASIVLHDREVKKHGNRS